MRNALGCIGALLIAAIFGFLAGCNVIDVINDGGDSVYQGGAIGVTVVLMAYHLSLAVYFGIRTDLS